MAKETANMAVVVMTVTTSTLICAVLSSSMGKRAVIRARNVNIFTPSYALNLSKLRLV